MKNTNKLVLLPIIPLLLIGCTKKTPSSETSKGDASSITESISTGSILNSNVSQSSSAGSNVSSSSSNGKSSSSASLKDGEVNKTTWERALSKEIFENFKASSEAFVGPIELPYFGPAVSISIARKANITSDKNGAEIESIKENEVYSITDQAVIDYCKSISSEGSEYSPSEFIKTFLYQMKEYQGWEFVRNDTDDGYVYASKLSEPYSNYFKYTDNPDLLIEYLINPENNKYEGITVFSEQAEDQSGIFEMVDCLDAIKDKFDDAIFDESNKCYKIPMIYFLGYSKEAMELDYIEAIKDQYFQLYFANGRVSKLTVDLRDVTQISGATSFTFTSYGDANVAFPVVTNTCTHPGCDYVVNDNYHFTRCSECGSVLTYEKHQYVEGECSTCGFYIEVNEPIKSSDGVTRVVLEKNGVSDKVYYVDLGDLHWSEKDSSYVCDDESCNFTVGFSSEDIPEPGNKCYTRYVNTYTFYENGKKVHDDVMVEDFYEHHSYEIVEYGEISENPYQNYWTSYEIHRGTVKCSECGKVVEDADIYLVYSDEGSDTLSFYKDGFKSTSGGISTKHKVDPTTHKCIYCGKDESEIKVVVDFSQYDNDYVQTTYSNFKSKFGSEFKYEEFTNNILVDYYDGDVEEGFYEKYDITYSNGGWNTDSTISAIVNMIQNIERNSYELIEYLEDCSRYYGETVTYFDGETIGKVVVENSYGTQVYYINEDCFFCRYEYFSEYADITFVQQVTFTGDM